MNTRTISLLLITSLLIVPLTASTIATTDYGLSATPSIDTPDRTVTYDGTEFSFTAITQTTTDDTVEITATAPSEESYYLQFRDPDNTVIERVFRTGESTYSVDFYGGGQAGTYAVLLRHEGEFQAIYPVIIPGYDVTVSAPETVNSDDSITVTANISERSIDRHSDLSDVEVVFYNEGHEVREQMEQDESGMYTQTIAADQLETEAYSVSVVVRGDAEVRGQDEVLALSEPRSMTVTEVSTPTETVTSTSENNHSDGTDSSGGGDTTSPPDTDGQNTQTERQTQSAPTTPTATQTTALPTVDTPTSQPTTDRETETQGEHSAMTGETSQSNQQTTHTPTTSGVLEPNAVETAGESTSPGSGPGFTIPLTIITIVSLIMWLRLD